MSNHKQGNEDLDRKKKAYRALAEMGGHTSQHVADHLAHKHHDYDKPTRKHDMSVHGEGKPYGSK